MKHLTLAKNWSDEVFNASSHRFIASSLHPSCCPALLTSILPALLPRSTGHKVCPRTSRGVPMLEEKKYCFISWLDWGVPTYEYVSIQVYCKDGLTCPHRWSKEHIFVAVGCTGVSVCMYCKIPYLCLDVLGCSCELGCSKYAVLLPMSRLA